MKKKSILLSWSLSYLVILLIPVAIGAAVFAESRHLLKEEVNRSNRVLLSQVQETIDSQTQDISSISSQLMADSQLSSFINHASEQDARWRLMGLELIKNLKSIRIGNGLIRELYIYVKSADVALSSSSLVSKNLLYDIYYEGTGVSEEEWTRLMQDSSESVFRKMKVFSEDRRIEETLVYLQPFPVRVSEDSPATFVVTLDPERFQQAINNVRLEPESIVFILDRNGRTLFSTGTAETPYSIHRYLQENKDTGRRTGTADWNGESVTVSQISSGVQDWQYVSIVPTRIYAKKLMVIRSITFTGVAAVLLLGGVTAWWFTRRNYRPLGRIMNIISDKVKGKLEQPDDEFGILQTVLTRAWEEQDQFATRLKEQQTVVRSGFLARLLKGRVQPGAGVAAEQEMERLGIRFESDSFAVLLVHIENYEGLFRTRGPEDKEGKLQFVHLILTNVLEELMGPAGPVYSAEMDGRIALLANIRENDADAVPQLIQAAGEAQHFIQSRFLIYFSVGVSSVRQSMAEISACYQESEEALEYRLILGIGQIIDQHRIRQPKEELYYPLDLERQLVNYIATGNYARSTEVMNEILMTNFAGEPLSVELARCLMFELIGTMLKATEQIKTDDMKELARRNELIRQLFACETFEEIEAELLQILETVCQMVHERKRSHNTELKEQLLEFIHENYADVNLGLTPISERFRFHPTYVSKYFKEQTGTNVIDYINQYRITEAKRLLQQDELNVQEVSERVGFLNSNSFIRVFKKYEGITPGQYRQNNRLIPHDNL
ncbi:helix-turn-helix domain-containing protein [Paenibacillus tritici]|uniref:Helix-turn-helix domain-containing protein n=1 Tax=Paenibacillus tritici TaxID=1873425 RepID=A0ABX2DQG4_9BACL|nr:helix-turn-helix domain-containing protein [Paenibacillus tritici]NQX46875.1 helix-turn-helix domain-containing protein [Paenibacillus tritici]